MKADYIIIGSGIHGAVIARALKDAGKEVVIVERRPYIGGELHETIHHSGIRIHSQGPQYFQTSRERVWRFVNRFGWFYQFEQRVKIEIKNHQEQWPLSTTYLARHGIHRAEEPTSLVGTLAEVYQKEFSPPLYRSLFAEYLTKQWGTSPSNLPSYLAEGIEAREGEDDRYSTHLWQGLPSGGYKKFVENLLDGIPVLLCTNFLHSRDAFEAQKLLIYTESIDEYFDYTLGTLEYRGHLRAHRYLSDISYALPVVQVENPYTTSGSHVRTIEWKHMMAPEEKKGIQGTVLTQETAFLAERSEERELPLCDAKNLSLFARYQELSKESPKVLFCGTHGEFYRRPLDGSIAHSLEIVDRILGMGSLTEALGALMSASRNIKKLGEETEQPLMQEVNEWSLLSE